MGKMVSTVDLQDLDMSSEAFIKVLVDGEVWEVKRVRFSNGGVAVVELARGYSDWDLEVGKADWDEPMWETA